MKFGRENRHRAIFDDGLEQLLERQARILGLYRTFSVVKPESILGFEPVGRVDELNRAREQLAIVEQSIQKVRADISAIEDKEHIIHTARFTEPPKGWFRITKCDVSYPGELQHIPLANWIPTLGEGTRVVGVSIGLGVPSTRSFPHTLAVYGTPVYTIHLVAETLCRCAGQIDFYAKGSDIPSMKERLTNLRTLLSIYQQERRSLVENSESQDKILKHRKIDLAAISSAQGEIFAAMNHSFTTRLDQCDEVVQRLWKPRASMPIGNIIVDDFLDGIRGFRRARQQNKPPAPLRLDQLSELATSARLWFALSANGRPIQIVPTDED
jgi:hypothetical protein